MIRNHVTTVAAIFVCNLLLGCAQQVMPNAALLKLIAARHSHGSRSRLSSSYLKDFDPRPTFPTSPSASDDVSQLWLDSQPASGSAAMGSRRSSGEGEDEGEAVAKRFHPSAFFGSRGKRLYGDDDESDLYLPVSAALSKRFQQGFVASRGRRGMLPSAASRMLVGAERRRLSDGEQDADDGAAVAKRFDPSGFSGSRGKRYIPGLEALLLSQMYKKLDAEKWKRQSLRGFHAARG